MILSLSAPKIGMFYPILRTCVGTKLFSSVQIFKVLPILITLSALYEYLMNHLDKLTVERKLLECPFGHPKISSIFSTHRKLNQMKLIFIIHHQTN